MNRQTAIAAACFAAALLVVLSMGVLASNHTELVAGSEHTTDTDFNNAQELTNATVKGSGSSAYVQGLAENSTLDDFEDGNINGWTGDTGPFSANDSRAANGSWSMRFDGTTSTQTITHSIADATNTSYVAASINIDEHTTNVQPLWRARDSSANSGPYLRTGDDGSLLYADGGSFTDSGVDLAADTWYRTEFVDINTTSDTYSLRVRDSSGSVVFDVWDVGTFSSIGDVSEFQTAGNTDVYWIDDITVGSRYTRSEYVSANHTVEDAQEARVNLTLVNSSAAVQIQEFDGNGWNDIGGSPSISSGGIHTFDISSATESKIRTRVVFGDDPAPSLGRLHNESIWFEARAPAVDDASASPTGDLQQTSQNPSIDVTDADFPLAQSDELTVTFHTNRSGQIGSDTLTSNGTASISHSFPGGTTEWWANATDDYGLSTESQRFTVRAPAALEVYNETSPNTLVSNQGSLTIRFFAADEIFERTTTSGSIDMTGLPVGQEFAVKATIDGYHDRTVVIDSIYDQQRIWLLNESISSAEVRFTITDRTGNFESNPKLFVQRPLDLGSSTTWNTVAADYFGAAGVTTQLQTDVRYRLTVENGGGLQRSVGPYESSISETVTLRVGTSSLNLSTDADSYVFNATYQNDSGTESVVWGYNDPDDLTDSLTVNITERGNASNQLYENTLTNLGETEVTVTVPSDQEGRTWVVDWEADRDGETVGGDKIVGAFVTTQVSSLPQWLQQAIAMMTLVLTAGLFSQRNFAVGAVVVPLMAGAFWMAGWLTGVTSGAGIALALGVAIVWKGTRGIR